MQLTIVHSLRPAVCRASDAPVLGARLDGSVSDAAEGLQDRIGRETPPDQVLEQPLAFGHWDGVADLFAGEYLLDGFAYLFGREASRGGGDRLGVDAARLQLLPDAKGTASFDVGGCPDECPGRARVVLESLFVEAVEGGVDLIVGEPTITELPAKLLTGVVAASQESQRHQTR